MGFIVLGIDPGINSTGYGIIEFKSNSDFSYLDADTINPSRNNGMEMRLAYIFNGVSNIIERYKPEIMAIEKVFTGKNIRTSTILAYSRAAALVAAGIHGIPIREYNPTKVKSYLSGHAFAGKGQMAFIISKLLKINNPEMKSDASDALSIAFCCGLDHCMELRKKGCRP